MSKLVTIGVPIYKRLNYLPNVLGIIAAQDYADIDLLISDNGLNGTLVPEIVGKHYSKPYRFRQNPATVSGSEHYNQLIDNAIGEYVIILADDDEISPNFVSELVGLMEKHPQAAAALGREETIGEAGNVIRRSKDSVPETLSALEFIRANFGTHQYGFEAFCTFVAKTKELRECGGFPDVWAATSDEDLLMVKLSLGGLIALSTRCTFRKRFYEASGGYAIELKDLAKGIREFVACLDSDARLRKYAASHPTEWREVRGVMVHNVWQTYFIRWAGMYKRRMSAPRWLAAALVMPRDYYRRVLMEVIGSAMAAGLVPIKRHCPRIYNAYKAAKTKFGGKPYDALQ